VIITVFSVSSLEDAIDERVLRNASWTEVEGLEETLSVIDY